MTTANASSVAAPTTLRLATGALTSRSGVAAVTCFVVGVALMQVLVAMSERLAMASSNISPLDKLANLERLLFRVLPSDVARRVVEYSPSHIVLEFVLLAFAPLVVAVLAYGIFVPDVSRSPQGQLRRYSAIIYASVIVSVIGITLGCTASLLLVPGHGTFSLNSLARLLLASVVTALPSASVAAVVRQLTTSHWVAGPLALFSVVLVRYALPVIAYFYPPLKWLVPRTYELFVMSSEAERAFLGVLGIACFAGLMAVVGSWGSQGGIGRDMKHVVPAAVQEVDAS